jgi:hypothetical protein
MAADPRTTKHEGAGDLRALLAEVVDHTRALLRLELQLAKEEARQALGAVRRGLVYLGLSVVLAVLAAGALMAALIAALAIVWPLWLAAGAVALVLGAAGAWLLKAGSRQLSSEAMRPQATLEEIQETKRWLKART